VREPRCNGCGRKLSQVRVMFTLRRGRICEWCVQLALNQLLDTGLRVSLEPPRPLTLEATGDGSAEEQALDGGGPARKAARRR
jgi:hypothetical protein